MDARDTLDDSDPAGDEALEDVANPPSFFSSLFLPEIGVPYGDVSGLLVRDLIGPTPVKSANFLPSDLDEVGPGRLGFANPEEPGWALSSSFCSIFLLLSDRSPNS